MIIEILFMIAIILILLIHLLFRSVVKTCKEVNNESKLSGFEIAKILSSKYCQDEPHIIKKSGRFLDHYNKDRNTIKLTPEVFDGEDIYASLMAINVALETDQERKIVPLGRKINSFFVLASYIVIIFGAFANNTLVIHLGMVLFILTIIFEFFLLTNLWGSEEKNKQLQEIVKNEELIKPMEEFNNNYLLIALSRLATLPYNFINYFR